MVSIARLPKSVTIPFRTSVLKADPDFEMARRQEIEYEMTGRVFKGNSSTRGPYSDRTEAADAEATEQQYPEQPT